MITTRKAMTREQIARELGISVKKFRKWLKEAEIVLPSGLITAEYQQKIIDSWEGHKKAK